MMNFRKIAAASKGMLILRYMTQNTPEPSHSLALDAAGRQLEEGGRLTSYYTGRDSRATWRSDMPALIAKAIGVDARKMPRDKEMSRLFEGRRGRIMAMPGPSTNARFPASIWSSARINRSRSRRSLRRPPPNAPDMECHRSGE